MRARGIASVISRAANERGEIHRVGSLVVSAALVLTSAIVLAVAWPGATAATTRTGVSANVERHSPCDERREGCTRVEFAVQSGPDAGQLVAVEFEETDNNDPLADELDAGNAVRLRALDLGAGPGEPAYELIGAERSERMLVVLAAALGVLALITGFRAGRAVAGVIVIGGLVATVTLPTLAQPGLGSAAAVVVVGASLTMTAALVAVISVRPSFGHVRLTAVSWAGAVSASLAADWLSLSDVRTLAVVGGLASLAIIGLRHADASPLVSLLTVMLASVVPALATLPNRGVTPSGTGLDHPALAAAAALIAAVAAGLGVHRVAGKISRAASAALQPETAATRAERDDEVIIDLRPAVRREPEPTEKVESEPTPSLLGKLRAGLDD